MKCISRDVTKDGVGRGGCEASEITRGSPVNVVLRHTKIFVFVMKLLILNAHLQECRPKDIPEDNQEIKYISGDVTKPEDCARAVAGGPALPDDQDSESAGAKREVDFLICCAGAADPGYFLEQDISKYRWMMVCVRRFDFLLRAARLYLRPVFIMPCAQSVRHGPCLFPLGISRWFLRHAPQEA